MLWLTFEEPHDPLPSCPLSVVERGILSKALAQVSIRRKNGDILNYFDTSLLF
jgi:hypothetical protein